MAVLQGAGRICPPHVCVIQKTQCGIGLAFDVSIETNVEEGMFFCIPSRKKCDRS